jgi:hypothetical protein
MPLLAQYALYVVQPFLALRAHKYSREYFAHAEIAVVVVSIGRLCHK